MAGHDARRRGAAAVAMVMVLIIIDLIVVRMVIAGGRDHQLTVRRLETVQAYYAAEAGVQMSLREIMEGSDEDGDGAAGTVSDDADDATDPAFGPARVLVTSAAAGDETTLTSTGRSGDSLRKLVAVTE